VEISLIINTNVAALNTYNKLNKSQKNLRKSLERLSSGKRINQADDDAAGLAISQKMKAQLKGAAQAQRNVQDGISMLQTAEGGLSEIQDPPLQRMRELALQAANDTYTNDDRKEMQEEFIEMKNSINDIANNTEFNNMKLLNQGPQKVEGSIKTSKGKEWEINFGTSPYKKIQSLTSTSDGSMVVAGNYEKSADPGDMRAWLSKLNDNGDIQWNINLPKDGLYNQIYEIKQLSDGNLVATTRSTNQNNTGYDDALIYKIDSQTGNIIKSNKITSVNYLFSVEEDSSGNILLAGSDIGNSKRTVVLNSNLEIKKYLGYEADDDRKTSTDTIEASDGGLITIGENFDTNNGFIRKYDSSYNLEWDKEEPSPLHSIIETNNGNYLALGEDGIYKIDNAGNINKINSEISFENNWFLSDDRTKNNISKTENGNYLITTGTKFYKIDEDGNKIWEENLEMSGLEAETSSQLKDDGLVIGSGNKLVKYELKGEIKSSKPKTLQVGPNSNDNFDIELADARTESLGLEDIKITSTKEAQKAIEVIDKAIAKISSERSKFGSYQNRLEHTENNLQNYNLNLNLANSRIEDADLAKEMVEMSKQQILSQAGTAMLAHANNLPQGVLQLIS